MYNIRGPFLFRITILGLVLAACGSPPAQMVDDFDVSMVLIPVGEVGEQGERAENPANLDAFYLDLYEVTNGRYGECMAAGACGELQNPIFFGDSAYQEHPVVFVTWDMAQTYCDWRGARLPTRAEWEFAAREELAAYETYWGDDSPVCQVGSRLGAAIDERETFEPGLKPVGGNSPNEFGLYDLTGNAWEWVQDPYPGGGYLTSPSHVSFLRMSGWSGYGPVYSRFVCSFRCARSP
jgi:formylglycine-generating enzyme required for sulfatase activity